MSCATVTGTYSSQAAHKAITAAAYKLKQAFALIDLLGPLIPFLFCFLPLSLLLVEASFAHNAQQCQATGDLSLGCRVELSGSETLCSVAVPSLPGCVSQGAAHQTVFLLKSTVVSKMDQTSAFSFPSPHLLLHSTVFSRDVICLSFHAEYERKISLFLT